MKSAHKYNPIPIVLLVISGVTLLFLVGLIIGLNIRVHRQPVYYASSPAPTAAVAEQTAEPTPTVKPFTAATPKLALPSDPTPSPYMQINAFTDRFFLDGAVSTSYEYRSPDLAIYFKRVYDTETFNRRVTYFVAEIFASDVTQIQTASCKDDFTRMGHGDVEEMAKKHDAIVAISGDYYGFHSSSLVIRNGTVYRKKMRAVDVCLLLRDGTMETIRSNNADIDEILSKDPWQAWQFGPSLLDEGGYARTSFPGNTLNHENPRSCIGYVEPGHYFFVVVDGRQKYSRGVTLTELASLMESLGCVQAYNLDGGASAHFYWNDQIVSNPSGGGREISDIIYIAKEAYPACHYFCGKDGLKN